MYSKVALLAVVLIALVFIGLAVYPASARNNREQAEILLLFYGGNSFPAGTVYLTDSDGAYLTDSDGAYITY